MSVLLGKNTRVIVQGLGREGRFHAERMKEYGTKVVGGTKPGAGGTSIDGIPMFDTVAQAVDATGANASIVFVPAPAAMDALLEAIDAQIDLVIAITEGIPIADMLKVAAVLETAATTEIYTLSLHDALPISRAIRAAPSRGASVRPRPRSRRAEPRAAHEAGAH